MIIIQNQHLLYQKCQTGVINDFFQVDIQFNLLYNAILNFIVLLPDLD